MNKQEINNILSELYSIDPGLKQHEAELKQVIVKFMAAKPSAELNAEFKQALKSQLLKKAEEFKPLPREDIRGFSWAKLFTVRNFAFTAVGAAIVVVIMVVAFNRPSDSPAGPTFTGGLSIEKLSASAFGDLPTQDLLQAGELGALGRGGGGTAASAPATEGAVQMIAPDATNYQYLYEGDVSVGQTTMDVLKKATGDKIAAETSGLLDSFGLGMVDLKSFTNASIQNISLTQDKKYGYNIEVNMAMGTVSISEAWDQWYTDTQEQEPLTKAAIPADDELIALAANFVKEYSINLEAYGQPQVVQRWQGQSEDFVPESIQILYPLLINEKNVYMPGGEQTGLYVTVSIRQKKVTGLTNLAIQRYQSAPYETMQDIEALKEQIVKGGLYSFTIPGAAKTATITLGDPTVQYVVLSKFETNTYTEFLVPAFVFPVDDERVSRNNVVVPLIKDFFKDSGGVGGAPEPLMDTAIAPVQ